MVRGFRSVAVPAKIVVSKIDVHVVKRARYTTVDVTQTCLVKINDHNITISYFEICKIVCHTVFETLINNVKLTSY
jgi:hypothetical protein